ncbi:unnamed protein product [marine sediment metagenome]|uniref:Phospholipase D-like domain-containing protein n=1 Tax=marine sediment metagenome TaxID=412755 RepID=X1AMU4_9ZZZZ
MLEPGKRTLYIDALRPPSEYQLSWGIGTTYSLELETLLSVPLAFSLYECKNQKEILNNSIFALDAIRRNASKLVIFCQHGQIKVSSTDSLLYSYLEDMIVEVNPYSGGVFHPKIWLLRFKNQEGNILYKYVCLSRNITFDRSWDIILVLDGKPVEYEVPENDNLIKFVNFLPKIAVNKIEKNRLDIIKKISIELGKIKFNPPENFDNQFNFHFLGIDNNDSFPISDEYRRLLIVSPFLSDSFLNRFENVKQRYLVSTQYSLDKIPDDTLKKYSRIWVLDELAEDKSEDDISRLSGLHAKLYIGENEKSVTLWNGSSNATHAGFSSQNVEALVELRGERNKIGIDKFIDEKSENSIVNFLKEYGKTTLDEEEKEKENLEKELEKKLEEYKANLLKIGLGVKIRPESKELYKIIVCPNITNSKYFSKEIKGICYPITLKKQTNKIEIPLLRKDKIIFHKVPLLSLTSLVAFELNIKGKKISQKMEFVLNLPVEGMPERRNDKIIRAILRDSNGFIQYLRILLTENQNIFLFNHNFSNNYKGGYANQQNQIPMPLAEELIKALSRNPDKIKNIHDLIKELSKNQDIKDDIIPEEFKEMWNNIWRTYKNQ